MIINLVHTPVTNTCITESILITVQDIPRTHCRLDVTFHDHKTSKM